MPTTFELTGRDGNKYTFEIGPQSGRPPKSKIKKKRRNPNAAGIRPETVWERDVEWSGGFSDRPLEYDKPVQGHTQDMIEQGGKNAGGTLKFEVLCYSDPPEKEPHNKCRVTIHEYDSNTPPREVEGSPYSDEVDVRRQEELRQLFAKAYARLKPVRGE